MICLANSVKFGGRCVAGITRSSGAWIRPVSAFSDGSLTSKQYVLNNGKPAALLDVVKVSLKDPKPEIYQPENWLLEDSPWLFVNALSNSEACTVLSSTLDSGPVLLGNTSDRIIIDSLSTEPVTSSLTVIEPTLLQWEITTSFRGNRQTRAIFKLSGQRYSLSITDPMWRAKLSDLALGIYPRNICGIKPADRLVFTVSLGKPMTNGECYKLVAGVILLPSLITPL